MLQDIRANIQGTIAKIIIGLIVISFSIFGIESLLFSGGSNAVAEVNGEEIGPYALQQEISLQQRQLLSMLGDDADPALLDENRLSEQALQVLIRRELLTQAARDLGLVVADAALGRIIGSMEQFQVDGSFSPDLYRSALANLGFTPAMFRQRLEQDLLAGQLRAALAGTDFATPGELALAARIIAEGRDLRYVTLPLARYRQAVALGADDVRAYYEANAARFRSEESVILEYIELSLDDYREPVSEEQLRREFELVRDQYEQARESRVSHILFEGDSGERAARVAEAQAALAEGLDFAAAAARFSDDVGSAGAGGDLGFTAGDTFPDPMEEAIAALPVGEVSDPVETRAGTHLLLVTDRREGTAVTLDDVRAELTASLQDSAASRALLHDVEQLRDLAFNAADLDQPAAELDAAPPVKRSGPVTRGQQEGLFADPRLLQAAFSPDVLEAGHNSEVIELDPGYFLVLRVDERRPPEQLPLAAVRERITATLREERAREAARAAAREFLAQLRAGEGSVETLANAAGLDWQVELGARRDSGRLPAVLRERLFALEAPRGDSPVRDIASGDDSLYVLELLRVTPGELAAMSDAERGALRRQLSAESGAVLQQAYETRLRSTADIRVY